MTTITYAIGDIHGRRDLLDALLDRIETDAASRQAAATIIFTGDYVDRGLDSFGVIERLIAGPRRPQDRFICLRGNHDDLFVRALDARGDLPDWAWELYWHTIGSYGLTRKDWHRRHAGLRAHADFLASLPLTHDDETHLFVHAGIRPGVPLAEQTEHDLFWIREDFLSHDGPLPRRVVHGHTIIGDTPIVKPHRVSIDTGAYRSGLLSAAVFDGTDVTVLQARGAPDRAAIVREYRLTAKLHGYAVTPALERAFGAYVEGGIDLADLERHIMLAAA